ncbi:MAG: hypothetical protein DRN96_07280 [Thermoproteota archaeon]|nr:MAG: hypothetical protein DRN96_07280 [Candidatus Korarchaeota archaeon]RLG54624.1 MAG: hypothetical protein DRN99_04785 [Candidatus Korarchaeota archaeon]
MIDSYSFGKVVVAGRTYTSDVIVYPDRVREGWWRREGHSLCLEDLKEVLEWRPDVLVVGTGAYGAMKVPESVVEAIESLGIRFVAKPTREAVEEFNRLLKSGVKAAAALHLTC